MLAYIPYMDPTSITIKSLFFDISVALTCQIARFRVHLEKSRSGVNKKVPRLFEKKGCDMAVS